MQTLIVNLGERSYPIHIGKELLGQSDLLGNFISGKQVLIVTNETVAPLYLKKTQAMLTGFQHKAVILPDGEQYKNLQVLNRIFDALLEQRFNRDCTLIGLGGGVIGDMTGFAAACYQRGVDFVQIPTTLLAQVDSSVGGKTGVNHALGKNMIGAFHQPRCVLIDSNTLNTLPDRELSAGMAEVIKYGLIRDLAFFEWLEDVMDALLNRESNALISAIARSCQNKAEIVAQDERENGVRALLNLGHTFGHAIEAGLGYGVWLHGEAVAAGMCLAAELSNRLNWLTQDQVNRVVTLLRRANLPVQPPSSLNSETLLHFMAVDKKVQQGRLRLILLKSLGTGTIFDAVDPSLLRATLDACRVLKSAPKNPQ
jgi:3-dehydroquinate synthase